MMMPTSVQQLALDNHQFAYRTYGSGPDVLLIHGWLSSSRMWDGAMAYLAAQYRVWAIDLVGFGDSRPDDPGHVLTVDDQTRLVAAFCDAVDMQHGAVIGHSMGGAIALKLALEYPHLIDKLVLVCSVVSGRFGHNLDSLLATPFGKTMLAFGQYLWPTVTQLSHQVPFLIAPGYLTRDVVRRSLEDFQKAAWGAAYGGLASMVNIGLDRRLHEIKQPTLVIAGGRDRLVPCSEGRLAAENLANAELLEIPTCHHEVPDEVPEQFYEAIDKFLETGLSRSAYAA